MLTKVWLDAGFESEQVDMKARKLVFRRVRNAEAKGEADKEFVHPAYGAMEGLIRINDRIIAATARELGATLITRNRASSITARRGMSPWWSVERARGS